MVNSEGLVNDFIVGFFLNGHIKCNKRFIHVLIEMQSIVQIFGMLVNVFI